MSESRDDAFRLETVIFPTQLSKDELVALGDMQDNSTRDELRRYRFKRAAREIQALRNAMALLSKHRDEYDALARELYNMIDELDESLSGGRDAYGTDRVLAKLRSLLPERG